LTLEQKKALGTYPEKFGEAILTGVGLFLWGTNSTGKTHVASSLCIEAIEKFRVSAYMIRAAELKDAWIKDCPANVGSDESTLDRVSSVRFLVIDDLGKEYRTTSGFSEANFGSLLRDRTRNNLVTCITTNMNPKEFSTTYGPSTGELVKECMLPIKIPDQQHRDRLADRVFKFFRGE
jgi:DNA replication protein DnaC